MEFQSLFKDIGTPQEYSYVFYSLRRLIMLKIIKKNKQKQKQKQEQIMLDLFYHGVVLEISIILTDKIVKAMKES